MNSYFSQATSLFLPGPGRFVQAGRQLLIIAAIVLLLVLPVYAQEQPVAGDTLTNVTISEDEARSILQGLFDVTRLSHSLAIGKIARDERLTTFTDGFVQRNNIRVLTIGYIDSDQFWPRIFREQRLGKIEKTETDQLLAARVIFSPEETEEAITGYLVTLELTGKTQQVYELLQLSRVQIDSIAIETSQQQLATPFANPGEAQETVVNALIAALEGVEGVSNEAVDSEARELELAAIRLALIQEALADSRGNIESWQSSQEPSAGESEPALYMCFEGRENGLGQIIENVDRHQEAVDELLAVIKEDSVGSILLEAVSASSLSKQAPFYPGLSQTNKDRMMELLCPYMVEGVEEELPELVKIEPIVDDMFTPGIGDDKLEIHYSIEATERFPLQYAKIEIYKNDGTLAYVNDEAIEMKKGGVFEWDGQVNQNLTVQNGIYIRSDESPFTVKLIASANEELSDIFQAEIQSDVHPMVDSFLDNYNVAKYIEATSDMEKFEYYEQLAAIMYNEISSNYTNERIVRDFANPLDYLNNKLHERTFLGREITVHDNYWKYLQIIESELGREFVNHPNYTMGGFNIRFQRNSKERISNHSYGMAIDVNWARNPYLVKSQLYFLQLLTGFKFYQHSSSPEELKAEHEKLVNLNYGEPDIEAMKAGFQSLDKISLAAENFDIFFKEVIDGYRSAASTFEQLNQRNTYLRNELHFFRQKTPQDVAGIERQLFEDLPIEADKLWEKVKSLRTPTEFAQMNELCTDGYLRAFLLKKHAVAQATSLLSVLEGINRQFDFEVAITSLKEACQRPANNDYSYWVTSPEIAQPQTLPEADSYQSIIALIKARQSEYQAFFGKKNGYADIISILSDSNSGFLAQNGFMDMAAKFARAFIDVGEGSVISWGGSWEDLKDFMHFEYVAKDKF